MTSIVKARTSVWTNASGGRATGWQELGLFPTSTMRFVVKAQHGKGIGWIDRARVTKKATRSVHKIEKIGRKSNLKVQAQSCKSKLII